MTEQPHRPGAPRVEAGAGDYVRDALAVLFLLLPLGMAWDLEHRAIGYDVIVPVTLLSILSLALPYLTTASVLPAALTAGRLRTIRLVANVPYLIVVLGTLVRAYADDTAVAGVSNGADVGDGIGVGMGVVFGLAGVMLAAQGRVAERRTGLGGGHLWRLVIVILAALGVVLALASAAIFASEFTSEPSWSEFVILGLGVVVFAGAPLIAVTGVARGDGAWRDATVVIGVVGLVAALWAQGAEETMGSAWSLRLAGPQILLWPALGAAAAAPGLAALVARPAGAARWVSLAARLFQMVTLVAVVAMLIAGFRLIDNPDDRGAHIAGIVFALVVIVAATFGRASLVKDARTGRPVALGMAGVLVLVMVIQTTVMAAARTLAITVDMATILSLWLVFAIAIVLVLVVPESVQEELDQRSTSGGSEPGPSSSVSAEGGSVRDPGPEATSSQ